MYRIQKDFPFSASHQLEGLTEDHPCSRLHGHNYIARAELKGELDDVGFVLDYRQMAGFGYFIDRVVDHRHLNDVVTFNPTAEQLAEWLRGQLIRNIPLMATPRIFGVRVGLSETPKTWAYTDWLDPQ